ncbi:sugar porter family MFS transporter [Ascoidea rubescens DSM 1968]|uniref:General substrate transporter n=1 Tax=Ascoidea rubescens DSM 1968 TaxID=1344418 RepID=A0A1D2VS03_9ASCO|nr:general substrate transporter [Ascoidea rubescens DSM 1968]ODV64394.1 general substrate transporter [Ascoidea rubescens DSM 1968]
MAEIINSLSVGEISAENESTLTQLQNSTATNNSSNLTDELKLNQTPSSKVDADASTINNISKVSTNTAKSKRKTSWVPIILCISISFGGFIFGWDTGTIGGISNMPAFLRRFADQKLNPNTGAIEYRFEQIIIGLIISSFNIGCAIGGLIIPSQIGDRWGRRWGIINSVLVYFVGLVIQLTATFTSKWYQILIGRVIAGISVGATSVLVPMFISESAPKNVRGALVVFYQLMITLGIFTGYIADFITKTIYKDDRQWQIPLSLSFVWGLMILMATFYMPESARFLIENDRQSEAINSLAKLNNVSIDDPVINEEVDEMVSNFEKEKAAKQTLQTTNPWIELLKGQPKLAFRLLTGILIMSFQQLSGCNYFFYYGTSLFNNVGMEDGFLTAIILGGVNFVCTFLGIYIVERLGRRACLIFGSILMGLCMVVYASVGSFGVQHGEVMIAFTCFYILGFACTWGPVAFVVVSEIYPIRVKSQAMALATSTNWMFNFVISLVTPFITSKIGYKFGYFFAACLLVSGIFVSIFMPETKGLALEDVDRLYEVSEGYSKMYRARKHLYYDHYE